MIQSVLQNPVLRKELLTRMRLRQPLSARAGVLFAIAALLLWIYWQVIAALLQDNTASAARGAWQTVIWVQFALIVLIAPVSAANAITQEKEQQTWEMLVFTRLTPAEIIFGKLLARLAMLLLLILLGLPVAAFCAAGSAAWSSPSEMVSFRQFCGTYLVMFNGALFYATFGLFASWKLKRTLYAILAAYTLVIGVCTLGTLLITVALSSISHDSGFFERSPFLWVNPIFQIGWATAPRNSADMLYLLCGSLIYAALTGLMLWRMVAGFRRNAQEAG